MPDTKPPIPKAHDLWGTPPEVAEVIVDHFKFDIMGRLSEVGTRMLEPSCGDGVFIKALIKAGVPAHLIVGVEIDERLCKEARRETGVDIYHGDFLTDTRLEGGGYIALGNPPFGGEQALFHTARLKALTSWFAILGPSGLMEPCENRGEWRRGLRAIYPLYLRRFRDLRGDQGGAGQRPTFLYQFQRGTAYGQYDHNNPRVDYVLQDRIARGKVELASAR